jgi:membrane fusion protein, multidrug efflux system
MSTEPKPPASRRKLGILGVVAVAGALTLVVTGIRAREDSSTKLKEWTDDQAVPSVAVIYPSPSVLSATIDLPGRLEAYYRAPIFARVNGYVKSWSADIGARVKAGEVIAEIDAPDLDQQLLQARADLTNQQASAKLSEVTLARRKTLIASNFVSMQEIDERTADLSNKNASVNSSQANVERLEALAGYKKITVPFDGIVTARNTDVGALINAGSGVGGGSGPQLFRVADVHEMRVFVQVPQEISAGMRAGLTAEMSLPQYPDKTFKATVATTAEAINKTSRTLLVELHAQNTDNLLQPGTFAQVRFNLADSPGTLRIPTSALIFREDGPQVAILAPGDKVELRPIKLGRNLGTEFEVLAGLSTSDTVINSPPDSLSQGEQVRVAKDAPPPPAHEAEVR